MIIEKKISNEENPMRYFLLSCEIFHREMCLAISRSPNQVDIKFLPKGLHDLGKEGMQERVRRALDEIDEEIYDAVLLGYGLCNNGVVDMKARKVPLVVPRAHDCITLLLGDKDRYLEYFNSNPGTYFLSTGWIERGTTTGELAQLSVQSRQGLNFGFEELVEKYGEDNAKFLFKELSMDTHYRQYTFIEMGVEPNSTYEDFSRAEAKRHQWKFDKVAGDMSLIYRLVDGPWDKKDFLVVPPGKRIKASFKPELIVEAD